MPRLRTSHRGIYGYEKLQEALTELKEGRSLHSVSVKYNIPGKTLRRHRDGKVGNPAVLNWDDMTPIFPLNMRRLWLKK